MGEANYMVTVLYSDEAYPNIRFFKLLELAHTFYDAMCELHDDDNVTVQLWTLNVSTASWTLTSFN